MNLKIYLTLENSYEFLAVNGLPGRLGFGSCRGLVSLWSRYLSGFVPGGSLGDFAKAENISDLFWNVNYFNLLRNSKYFYNYSTI